MEQTSVILSPGQHPRDPFKKDVDCIGYALERTLTYVWWVEEHRASFESVRHSDPEDAESELDNLRDATREAMLHLQRLAELLPSGHQIEPTKNLPKSVKDRVLSRSAQMLAEAQRNIAAGLSANDQSSP